MGQAKERGSHEERAANPKGDSWNTWNEKYWTPDRLSEFRQSMSEELGTWIDKVRGDLFATRSPKKKRRRKVRTGG
jgi:hypothetical protein